MRKPLFMACFNTLLICVELHLSGDTRNSSDSEVTNISNVDDLGASSQVELLAVPQIPVTVEHHSSNEDRPQVEMLPNTPDTLSAQEIMRWHLLNLFRRQCGLQLDTCPATFLEFLISLRATSSKLSLSEDDTEQQVNPGVKKITCIPRNESELETDTPSVKIFNSSELLQHLGNRNSTNGRCTIVLFYAPWCVFSSRVAPHYNALARAFPTLDIVAIDAFHFSNLNSRFGTIAVPNVMIFHSAKAIARFNGSERTLTSLASFVFNVTGIEANSSVEVTDEDHSGPLQSEPSQDPDYLLLLSWAFVILCCAVGLVRSNTGLRVWNALVEMGHHEQHHHQHID